MILYRTKYRLLNKMLLFLVWIGITNGMINTPDLEHTMGKEDYNEMETITEWILEDVLQLEDSIEEHGEPDTDQKKSNHGIDFHAVASLAVDYVFLIPLRNQNAGFNHFFSSIPSRNIAPPPDYFVGI
ncbi:MAG: hypothetical protein NVV59_00305 [Chitinophagaceae bacterium]|nr:hypothetical protein [Chitinophagaceae bacterium]